MVKINQGFRPIQTNSRAIESARLVGAFVWPIRVYYEDTDAGGVVYHANYLRFMERARSEWLRALGWPTHKLADKFGLLFVVASLDMKFIRPAKLGDMLEVEVQVSKSKKASVVLQHQIRCDEALLVVSTAKLVAVSDKTFRPIPIPSVLRLG